MRVRSGALAATLGLTVWVGTQAQSVAPPAAKAGPIATRPGPLAAGQGAGQKVLLVDDDESDNNNIPGSGKLSASDAFYRTLLTVRFGDFDTVVVPRYADGPSLDTLRRYSLVVWYTGASYGGNRDNTAVISLNDERALTSYLQENGGTVLLFSPGYLNNALGAGGATLWAKKESPFLQQVLGIKGGRGLLQRFKNGTVTAAAGGTYEVSKSPSVETQFSAANPGTAQAVYTTALDPDGKGAQAVAVATSNTVGSGHVVYVGFTFENVAPGADAAFAQLLKSAGVAVQSAAASTPRRARTAELTVTGTGLLAAGAAPVAKRARTEPLTVTGIGALTAGAPFSPTRARTAELTVTGTGALQ